MKWQHVCKRLVRAVVITLSLVGSASLSANSTALYNLSLNDLEGVPQALAQYEGKPLVVNFWATWCAPCVEEMPELDALSQAYPHIQFVGIAVDTARNVHKFIERVPVSYDLLIAGHGGVKHMREIGNSKGGLPYTIILNTDGSVLRQVLGQIDAEDLRVTLETL